MPWKGNSSRVAAQTPCPLQAGEHGQDAYLTVYSCKSLPVATAAPTKAGKHGINHIQELKFMSTEKPIQCLKRKLMRTSEKALVPCTEVNLILLWCIPVWP